MATLPRHSDPQDHVRNQIARITRTVRDDQWRALDTASLRDLRAEEGERVGKAFDQMAGELKSWQR
jgi:hypothetical protein